MRYTDVFEHGIEIRRGEAKPARGLMRIATDQRPVHTGFIYEAVDSDGTSLNYRTMKLAMVQADHWARDYYEESDLRYCLRTAVYHLNRIIELYVAKRQEAARGNPSAHVVGFGGERRVYFEVDAFVGAARRIYEAINKLMWKHYAVPLGMTGRWRSITGAMRSDVVPDVFAQSLQQSWDDYGKLLGAYRDCIMHNVPLTDDGGPCFMVRLKDEQWGVTFPLPTNPETKSRNAFDNILPGQGIDALGYCHRVAAHMVALCEEAIALPAIVAHIANPRPIY
ncbi:hypothetical protein ACTXG7_24875 [Mycolicibacterium sp. Dal123E01]|uniref:hypothetical protein n=1 Tax=Mycolicibacterium sp. Dal123E01 TaxID=3457578 RepID=UPI00403E9B74